MEQKEFEMLLSECKNAIERFVRYRIPLKDDADDILQEIYLTAWLKKDLVKKKSSFKAWCIRIAQNKCNDYFRTKTKPSEISLDVLPEDQYVYTRFGIAEESIVHETLQQLSVNDKEVLQLYYFRGFSQAEIAEKLHIPTGTVKSRLHTAKCHFRTNYPYTPKEKGDFMMKKLPKTIPSCTIKKSEKMPFSVKWEELWGLFIIPVIGEKRVWGIYETDTKECTEWGELEVVGKAMVQLTSIGMIV